MRFPVDVADRCGVNRLFGLAIGMPEHHSWIADLLQRVPGHGDLRRRIGTEPRMQSRHRRCPDQIRLRPFGGRVRTPPPVSQNQRLPLRAAHGDSARNQDLLRVRILRYRNEAPTVPFAGTSTAVQ
jgi:hypothetical protein